MEQTQAMQIQFTVNKSGLTFCHLGNLSYIFVIWFIFFLNQLFRKFFHQSVYRFGSRSGSTFWSRTSYLKMLSADGTSKYRAIIINK